MGLEMGLETGLPMETGCRHHGYLPRETDVKSLVRKMAGACLLFNLTLNQISESRERHTRHMLRFDRLKE
jgi:hypothetical protein